jgi:hypothetical protein
MIKVVLAGLLLVGYSVFGVTNELPDVGILQSFEAGVPSHVTVSKGKLSISERYAQDGSHSLRWDWVAGDRLTIMTGPLGNIAEWTGYNGYYRSAIKFKIFNEIPQDSSLTFRWLDGEKLGGYFEFPLHVAGWQSICYHYSWHHGILKRNQNVLKATDRIVFDAPERGSGGTLYLDTHVEKNAYDWRQAPHPITHVWKPYDISQYPHKELLTEPTAEELAAVERFLPKRNRSGKVSVAQVA